MHSVAQYEVPQMSSCFTEMFGQWPRLSTACLPACQWPRPSTACLPVCQWPRLSTACLSVSGPAPPLPACLSVSGPASPLPACLSVAPPLHCLPVCQWPRPSTACLPVSLSACFSHPLIWLCLSVHLSSIQLSVSVCLCDCLSECLTASFLAGHFPSILLLLPPPPPPSGEGYCPKLAVVVVQKRISTRIFCRSAKGLDNPPPGTVVDHTITRRGM